MAKRPGTRAVKPTDLGAADDAPIPREPRRGTGRRGSADHLKRYRWRPGQSGNPRGRPKRKTFAEVFYAVLQEKLTAKQRREFEKKYGGKLENLTSATKMEVLARVIIDNALRANLDAFREIGDRLDPKRKRVEITGRDGEPVTSAQITSEMSPEDAARIYHDMAADESARLDGDGGEGDGDGSEA